MVYSVPSCSAPVRPRRTAASIPAFAARPAATGSTTPLIDWLTVTLTCGGRLSVTEAETSCSIFAGGRLSR
ncbi:MAG: hypothetical protein HPM95_12970 [Alphaproteobacteria bacterium]|nr:hypothetical protein [Alphaproteobacteria bacterium]